MKFTPQLHTLENGLRVVLIPMQETEIVTVNAAFHVGARSETKDISGAAHFLEHMAFKGTKKRPEPFLIAQAADAVGGSYNACTGRETTRYFMSVPAKHQELAYDIIADVLTNSLFEEAEFEREKGPICEEIKMYYDIPSELAHLKLLELVYGDTPLGWDIGGTIESVTKMKRDDIVDFYKTHYTAHNAVVTIAGKIDPERTLQQITSYFSLLPSTDPVPFERFENTQKKPRITFIERPIEQANSAAFFRGFGREKGLEKLAIQGILTDILGGYMSSQLFMEIREKSGLAYNIQTGVSVLAETGGLYLFAGTAPDKLALALEKSFALFRQAKEKGFTEEEIARAKENNIGGLLMSYERSSQVAAGVGSSYLFYGRHIPLDERIALVEAVTNEQLMELANEIFQMKNFSLVSVGPNKAEEAEQILSQSSL